LIYLRCIRSRCYKKLGWDSFPLNLWLFVPQCQIFVPHLTFAYSPIANLIDSSWVSYMFSILRVQIKDFWQAYGRFDSFKWELRASNYTLNTWLMSGALLFANACADMIVQVDLDNWFWFDMVFRAYTSKTSFSYLFANDLNHFLANFRSTKLLVRLMFS